MANINGDPHQARSRWGQSISNTVGKESTGRIQKVRRKASRPDLMVPRKESKGKMKGEKNHPSILTHLSSSIRMCKAVSPVNFDKITYTPSASSKKHHISRDMKHFRFRLRGIA